uniref:Uncharacterized protein n=1 Tax=Glossina palpalis gambiensis TaxID=67801 RepID=A0A1B0B1F2_9MUSC
MRPRLANSSKEGGSSESDCITAVLAMLLPPFGMPSTFSPYKEPTFPKSTPSDKVLAVVKTAAAVLVAFDAIAFDVDGRHLQYPVVSLIDDESDDDMKAAEIVFCLFRLWSPIPSPSAKFCMMHMFNE